MSNTPKRKKGIEDQIPWQRKLFHGDWWRYVLLHKPAGNALILLVVLVIWAALVTLTQRTPNSLTYLAFNIQENKNLQTETVTFICYQCFFLYLIVKAGFYWVPLAKAQRNIVGLDDHLRPKFWAATSSVLIIFWMAFHLDPILGAVVSCYSRDWLLSQLPDEKPIFVEGRETMHYHQAKAFHKLMTKPEVQTYLWGGVKISETDATRSFLWLGQSGSGKSLSIQFLLQDIIPQISPGSGKRAIINDHNQSILPDLYGLGINAPVYLLNPFDQRGCAWDLAKDFKDPDALLSMGAIFVPQDLHQHDNFFTSATRVCFIAISYLFSQTAPNEWRLRDVLLALFSRDHLFALLGNCPLPNVKKALEVLGGSQKGAEKQQAGVMGTIITALDKFSSIAALSDYHASQGRKISLTEWSQTSSLLLLGNSNTADEAMGLLNRTFLHRACEVLMDLPSAPVASNFIFADELPGLGYQPKLAKLALEGRKRGVCLVLGVQSIASLTRVYGKERMEEMVEQIEHKGVLSLSGETTPKWAANVFGDQVISVNGKTECRWVVTPSDFLDIPLINPHLKIGLTGYYSGKVVHKHKYSFSYLKKNLRPKDENIAPFIPAPSEYKHLQPWDDEDLERLGIRHLLKGESSTGIDWGMMEGHLNRADKVARDLTRPDDRPDAKDDAKDGHQGGGHTRPSRPSSPDTLNQGPNLDVSDETS